MHSCLQIRHGSLVTRRQPYGPSAFSWVYADVPVLNRFETIRTFPEPPQKRFQQYSLLLYSSLLFPIGRKTTLVDTARQFYLAKGYGLLRTEMASNTGCSRSVRK